MVPVLATSVSLLPLVPSVSPMPSSGAKTTTFSASSVNTLVETMPTVSPPSVACSVLSRAAPTGSELPGGLLVHGGQLTLSHPSSHPMVSLSTITSHSFNPSNKYEWRDIPDQRSFSEKGILKNSKRVRSTILLFLYFLYTLDLVDHFDSVNFVGQLGLARKGLMGFKSLCI